MSALEYVEKLENIIEKLDNNQFHCMIASGGRMNITMDRYGADWDMVKRGWDTHVLGEGRQFINASTAIRTYRNEYNVIDQYLPPFVIGMDGKAVGAINDNDSVILFNFRGDRAIELCMAFENENFPYFDRIKKPNVIFAGMLQYDGDYKIPKNYLVNPPNIKYTLSELLVENGLSQFAVSETQKYGHVTYFWNGNRSEKFDNKLETFFEISSDKVKFDERPWMKSAEIVDKIAEVAKEDKYNFIRCNFPNGDMVGHTGNLEATIIAVEAVDLALSRLIKIAEDNDYILIVTADHGNADEMYEMNNKGEIQVRSAHSLNLVPFIICNKDYSIKEDSYGLANVAPTIADIFEIKPYETWEESMLKK